MLDRSHLAYDPLPPPYLGLHQRLLEYPMEKVRMHKHSREEAEHPYSYKKNLKALGSIP